MRRCVTAVVPARDGFVVQNNVKEDVTSMKKIRVAIAGVGNCASSLIQGLEYYRGRNETSFSGLMNAKIGDWGPSDIEIVAAFDVDRRKVGKRVEEAIFAKPNCTKVFQSALPAPSSPSKSAGTRSSPASWRRTRSGS